MHFADCVSLAFLFYLSLIQIVHNFINICDLCVNNHNNNTNCIIYVDMPLNGLIDN